MKMSANESYIYIYIYIYVCVCVCVCVYNTMLTYVFDNPCEINYFIFAC